MAHYDVVSIGQHYPLWMNTMHVCALCTRLFIIDLNRYSLFFLFIAVSMGFWNSFNYTFDCCCCCCCRRTHNDWRLSDWFFYFIRAANCGTLWTLFWYFGQIARYRSKWTKHTHTKEPHTCMGRKRNCILTITTIELNIRIAAAAAAAGNQNNNNECACTHPAHNYLFD